jgi:uncharacterized membrane protein
VGFAAITLFIASQRVFVVVYFIIDLVRKLLDTLSYLSALFAEIAHLTQNGEVPSVRVLVLFTRCWTNLILVHIYPF